MKKFDLELKMEEKIRKKVKKLKVKISVSPVTPKIVKRPKLISFYPSKTSGLKRLSAPIPLILNMGPVPSATKHHPCRSPWFTIRTGTDL